MSEVRAGDRVPARRELLERVHVDPSLVQVSHPHLSFTLCMLELCSCVLHYELLERQSRRCPIPSGVGRNRPVRLTSPCESLQARGLQSISGVWEEQGQDLHHSLDVQAHILRWLGL